MGHLYYIIYACCVFSIIDVILTFFTLWFDKKLYPDKANFSELNFIGGIVIKKTNGNSLGFLIMMCISQFIIWSFGLLLLSINYIMGVCLLWFMFGALFVTNWVHYFHIIGLYKSREYKIWKDSKK